MIRITSNWRKILILLGIVISFSKGFAQDYTIEELKNLREKNIITEEAYQILLFELGEGELLNENLYKISIDGRVIGEQYKLIMKENQKYFPLLSFLKLLNFTNYTYENKVISIKLGENLREVEINLKKEKIKNNNQNIDILFEKNLLQRDDEIYLEENLFKELFLSNLDIKDNYSRIDMKLNFNSPEIIKLLAEKNKIQLENRNHGNELVYEGKNKLHELGNLKVEVYTEYEKNENSKKGELNYVGEFEYQGNLLYGDFITGYNTKENRLDSTYLTYKNLIKDHEFKIGSYSIGEKEREIGLSLRKNKGFYENGKNYVIEYDVPIGSKVELLYAGVPIEIQTAQEGKVRFENSQITSDRTYQLKIYTPDGKISIEDINILPNYNIQNKGEVEYNLEFREHNISKKVAFDGDIYYGVTDKLTLGAGWSRKPEKIDDNYKNIQTGKLQLGYTNFIKNKYSYVIETTTERTLLFNDNILKEHNYQDKYTNDISLDLDLNKARIYLKGTEYGSFYDEKYNFNFSTDYDLTNQIRLGYSYDQTAYKDNKKDANSIITGTYDYKVGNMLFTNRVGIADDSNENYLEFNIYSGDFFSNSISLENMWSGKNLDYMGRLNLYNGNLFSNLNYNFALEYSENEKEKIVLEFKVELDNLFFTETKFGSRGTRKYKAGIDTVVDLRTIDPKNVWKLKTVNDLNSANVKVIAFIDGNNNNKFDEYEELLNNVEITIGGQKSLTNEKGEAYFYGVPSGAKVELKSTIRRPTYTLGDNKIFVEGNGNGTIEAFIPVKPMMTLNGILEIDKELKLNEIEKTELYENIVIEVKDKNGKLIEATLPDENGSFIVSGLFTEEYELDIQYIGTKYKIKGIKEKVQIVYHKNNIQDILFELANNKIVLNN